MINYLKYLVQLLLAPAKGWEDIENDAPDGKVLTEKGLYPLLGAAACSEAMAWVWERNVDLRYVLMHAVMVFGAYFVSVFLSRIILETYIPKVSGEPADKDRTATFTACLLGIMVLFRILDNCLPGNVIFLQFLPLYAFLVVYKAAGYLGVGSGSELRFMLVAGAATILIPLVLYYLLILLV